MLVVCLRCVVRVPRSHTLFSHTYRTSGTTIVLLRVPYYVLVKNCEFTYPGLCTRHRVLWIRPATCKFCEQVWIHISGSCFLLQSCTVCPCVVNLQAQQNVKFCKQVWIHISGSLFDGFREFALCEFAICKLLWIHEFTHPSPTVSQLAAKRKVASLWIHISGSVDDWTVCSFLHKYRTPSTTKYKHNNYRAATGSTTNTAADVSGGWWATKVTKKKRHVHASVYHCIYHHLLRQNMVMCRHYGHDYPHCPNHNKNQHTMRRGTRHYILPHNMVILNW